MRIFLHPRIRLYRESYLNDRLLPICADTSRLRTPITHELIYLHKPGDEGWVAWNNEPVKPATTNLKILKQIYGMRDLAPPAEHDHYVATLASIDRARNQLQLPIIAESDP